MFSWNTVYAENAVLVKSQTAFDKILKSCSAPQFLSAQSIFENTLIDEVIKISPKEREKLLYKKSKAGLIYSFFGSFIGNENRKQRLPLVLCWTKLDEVVNSESSEEKIKNLDEWRSCTEGIFKEKIPLVEQYYLCRKKSLIVSDLKD